MLGDPEFSSRFMAMWSTNMALGIEMMGQQIGRELNEDEVEPVNWAQAEYAKRVSGVEYGRALAAVSQFRRAVRQWWADGWARRVARCRIWMEVGRASWTAVEWDAAGWDSLRADRRVVLHMACAGESRGLRSALRRPARERQTDNQHHGPDQTSLESLLARA